MTRATTKITIFFMLTFLQFAHSASRTCQILGQITEDLSRLGFVANTPDMQEALLKVAKYADTDATVLITGETGTGKEMIAKLIHSYNSKRRLKAYVTVDSTRIKGETAESRLFGHEMGSFTGAIRKTNGFILNANGGTLFIDEVADLSMEVQGMLLRFLNDRAQDRTVQSLGGEKEVSANVRVVLATNVDLATLVQQGKFRQDLFYRINVARIDLKPLRERRDEILPLAERFLRKYSHQHGRDYVSFSEGAKHLLTNYAWPGNIRQLDYTIERSVLDGDGEHGVMDRKDIMIGSEIPQTNGTSVLDAVDRSDVTNLLERIEALALRDAYVRGNKAQNKAADLLGVSARVFNYKWKNIRPKFPELFPEAEFGPMPVAGEEDVPADLRRAS